MIDELIEAWRINNRVNLRLIEMIPAAGMKCTLSKRGGRNVVRQFTHLQYVRVYQLKRRARALAKGARTFAGDEEPSRRVLTAALKDSARRVEKWFLEVHAGTKGFRTLRPGLAPTVAYLIAHESHHRGNILLTLKECGHALDKDTRYQIWDWNHM